MSTPTATNGIHDRIRGIFRTKLNVEVPSADVDIIETGLIDSLTFVDLLLHLEQEFGRKISLESLEVDDFRSVSRIAEFLGRPDLPQAPQGS